MSRLTLKVKKGKSDGIGTGKEQIELMITMQQLSVNRRVPEQRVKPKPTVQQRTPVNVSAVAKLLRSFDGSESDYAIWEQQVRALKTTYVLTDGSAKLLIGSRVKDDLLKGTRGVIYQPENMLVARHKLQERVWKREESFTEYGHQKIILGNRVSVSDAEIVEYIIEGIPDLALRDLAQAQRVKTTTDLLESF
ncbi:hypothetical protein KM043_015696 [Ampulex compressa]|nr:hypothetical protein KM043_015696 [Ampulex compressa]